MRCTLAINKMHFLCMSLSIRNCYSNPKQSDNRWLYFWMNFKQSFENITNHLTPISVRKNSFCYLYMLISINIRRMYRYRKNILHSAFHICVDIHDPNFTHSISRNAQISTFYNKVICINPRGNKYPRSKLFVVNVSLWVNFTVQLD